MSDDRKMLTLLGQQLSEANSERDSLREQPAQFKVIFDDADFREMQEDYYDAVNKLLDVTEERDQLLNLIERAAPLLMDVPAKDKYGPNAPELNVEASFVVATEMYEALAKGED